VSIPVTKPPCDGGYILIVGSAVTPDTYAKSVQEFLNLYPDTKYLHAPSTGCSSLRARYNNTNADIYSVYYGPFPGKQAACDQKAATGGDSFVRRLDNTSSPDKGVTC
jgi:serine/threonine-protein kinase